MKKYEKEVLEARLDSEENVMKKLKGIYEAAAKDVANKIEISNGKINVLLADWDNLSDDDKSVYQAQIYHRNFQQSLKRQIDGFLKDLNSNQYGSIKEYLENCYTDGFVGAMYSINQQGIPLIVPIDQKKVVKAMFTDSQIKEDLYTSLVEDVVQFKKKIASTISRGVATADSYSNIARNIASDTKVEFNKAMRIARTEGARISNESALDASYEAKKAGASVVKQWCSTLDGDTRPHHRQLDGQIRELDEPFEIDGRKAMHPVGFGRPEEDINCRCCILQRATWALDDEELEELRKRAKFNGRRVEDSKTFGHEKAKGFADYKKKYLYQAEKMAETLANAGESSKIVVHKSLGAAAKKYQVKLADSDQHTKLVENQTITGKTFAGKGTDKEIRVRYILESRYHIPADEWQKVSGNGYVIVDGKKVLAELHWYEADGEVYEMKVKRYLNEG